MAAPASKICSQSPWVSGRILDILPYSAIFGKFLDPRFVSWILDPVEFSVFGLFRLNPWGMLDLGCWILPNILYQLYLAMSGQVMDTRLPEETRAEMSRCSSVGLPYTYKHMYIYTHTHMLHMLLSLSLMLAWSSDAPAVVSS